MWLSEMNFTDQASFCLGNVARATGSRQKAEVICDQTETSSNHVLKLFGVPEDPTAHSPNEIVKDFKDDLQSGAPIPEDIFRSLELLNVPPLFDASEGWHEPEFDMLFGEDRVLLYHLPSKQRVKEMGYEEAALFAVCWIAEAFLRALRSKYWSPEEIEELRSAR